MWETELAAPTHGWDFSDLDGRVTSDDPPWDFEEVCRAQLRVSSRVVDLGTGGGEALLRLADVLPADTTATEGWPPNVRVATRALATRGIPVLDWDADRVPFQPLPVPAGRFDLVLDRHESYAVPEVARVLAPGGVFLTQQVGSDDARELSTWFSGRSVRRTDWSLAEALREFEGSDLIVERAEEWWGCYLFADVAALMRYCSKVPWDLPVGFRVRAHADELLRLQESLPFTVTQHRWLVRARRR
jgi:SAM-dependent methyltransferase